MSIADSLAFSLRQAKLRHYIFLEYVAFAKNPGYEADEIILKLSYVHTIDLNMVAGSSMVTVNPKTLATVAYEQNLSSKNEDIWKTITNVYFRFLLSLYQLRDSLVGRLEKLYNQSEANFENISEGTYKCENGKCQPVIAPKPKEFKTNSGNQLKSPNNELTEKVNEQYNFQEPPEPLVCVHHLDMDRIRREKEMQHSEITNNNAM